MKAAELAIDGISNPFKVQEAAKEMALRVDLAPDDVEILRGILQPWWDTERDAQALCGYLGALGAIGGQGSMAHRRTVKIAVLCARTVISKVREQDRAETNQILDTFDTWARGEASDSDFQTVRDRAWAFWSAVEDDASAVGYSEAAANSAVHAASAVSNAADAATDNTADFAAQNAVLDAAHAVSSYHPDTPDWIEFRDLYIAHLADMIRTEIPLCPVGAP